MDRRGARLYLDGVPLLLSRLPASRAARGFLTVLLAYGIANMANDDWLEQVVERGWASYAIPSVLGFSLNRLWLAVLVTAVAVYALSAGAWRDAGP